MAANVSNAEVAILLQEGVSATPIPAVSAGLGSFLKGLLKPIGIGLGGLIGGPAGAALGGKIGGFIGGRGRGGGIPDPGFGDPNRFGAPIFTGGGGGFGGGGATSTFEDDFSAAACAAAAATGRFPRGCPPQQFGPTLPQQMTPTETPSFTNGCMTGVNIAAVLPADTKMILSSRPGYTLVQRAGCEPFQIQNQYAKDNKIRLPKKTGKAKITAAEFRTLSTAKSVERKIKTLAGMAGLTTAKRGASRGRKAPVVKSCGCP